MLVDIVDKDDYIVIETLLDFYGILIQLSFSIVKVSEENSEKRNQRIYSDEITSCPRS